MAKKSSPGKKKRSTPTTRKPVKKKVKKVVPRKAPANADADLKRIDKELIKLMSNRISLLMKLKAKEPDGNSVQSNFRSEDALWEQLEKLNSNGAISNIALRGIFRILLSESRRGMHMPRVSYLGPSYSFTHLAAMERFGENTDLVPVNTIAAVFESVNRGHADYGVVPIENSTDGRVVDTLDMFTRLPLRICGEVQIGIHHNLLAKCPRSEITEIYSKPQAFSQCREWLAKNMPQARLIEVTSTSTAAQLARDKHGAAAVASHQAALEYNLDFVAENIEDNANNVTRFAIIGHDDAEPTGRDRTALLLQIPHEPGSLGDALAAFKKHKINLTWIESYPLRGSEEGYLFFLDFEGHVKEARIKRAIEDLEKKAVRMEILGSYPRCESLK
ncbi:MAG: prephenate dehydratase [Planctomycetaceae bacterium]|nr:prephenate dehydratase [Planctomycetaceae bacterium]